jgi:hypothetical protein
MEELEEEFFPLFSSSEEEEESDDEEMISEEERSSSKGLFFRIFGTITGCEDGVTMLGGWKGAFTD